MFLCKGRSRGPSHSPKTILLSGWEPHEVGQELVGLLSLPKDAFVSAYTTEQSEATADIIKSIQKGGTTAVVALPEPHMSPLLGSWLPSEQAGTRPLTVFSTVPLERAVETDSSMPTVIVQNLLRYLLNLRGTLERTPGTIAKISRQEMGQIEQRLHLAIKDLNSKSQSMRSTMTTDIQLAFEAILQLMPRALGFWDDQQKEAFLEPRVMYDVIVDATKPSLAAQAVLRALRSDRHSGSVDPLSLATNPLELIRLLGNFMSQNGSGLGLRGTNILNRPKRYRWSEEKGLKPPFTALVDYYTDQHIDGIVGLKAPLRIDEDVVMYDNMIQKGIKFVGITSYQDWPGDLENPGDTPTYRHRDIFADEYWHSNIIGWIHAFRKPENHIPDEYPRVLLPESDFMYAHEYLPRSEKRWDVMYNAQSGSWQEYCRNWDLGRQCVLHMASMGLHVCIVGKHLDVVKDAQLIGNPNVHVIGTLQWPYFKTAVAMSRWLFVPNIHDASPRVVSEALASDIPVYMNGHIVGGWHYVAPETGEFFHNFDEFKDGLTGFLKKIERGMFSPRVWWTSRYGMDNASIKLAQFVDSLKLDQIRIDPNKRPKFQPVSPHNDEANYGHVRKRDVYPAEFVK
mmetsp:Transcript_35382/g.63246  ORF Transcript_35382/g.63246 Transcript_35382/m.63246 type:complete len:624 (-) Transcript_35382:507-2378(-)